MQEPRVVAGGIAVDDRGVVRFVNDFDFKAAGIRRFYTLMNHEVGYVRAWHGHKKEAKWCSVLSGSAIVCAVPLDEFNTNRSYFNTDSWLLKHPFHRFVLSAANPQILHIPAGYANGFKALEPNTMIVHFSDMAIGESDDDDVRFPANALPMDCWEVKNR